MALTPQQVRDVAADWASINYQRTGGTANFALDDIMTGVSQVDAGMVITGSAVNSTFSITGVMAGMTTRQTSIMVALVMMARVQLPLP